MVIDSSPLLAVFLGEPEGDHLLRRINSAGSCLISTATAIECSIVVIGRYNEAGLTRLRRLISSLEAKVVPLTVLHIGLAVEAFRQFGKGRHRAGHNPGDCLPYVLAKATGAPLLFMREDFARPDVARVA
jgi:ribonuclease VapC